MTLNRDTNIHVIVNKSGYPELAFLTKREALDYVASVKWKDEDYFIFRVKLIVENERDNDDA